MHSCAVLLLSAVLSILPFVAYGALLGAAIRLQDPPLSRIPITTKPELVAADPVEAG